MIRLRRTTDILNKINNFFEIPFEIKEKNWLLKIIVKKGVTISLGNAMYIDKNKNVEEYLIMHEAMHYADRCSLVNGIFEKSFIKSTMFYIKYAFPQILIILSLLAFINIWFLLFLLFAMPNPYLSFFRKEYELRGYFFNYLYNVYTEYSKIFNGKTYYKMDIEREEDYYIKRFSDIAKNPDEKTALLTNVFWH